MSSTAVTGQPAQAVIASLPDAQNRVEFVDGLRAVAALYVLLHHALLTVWAIGYNRYPEGVTGRLTGWLLYGHFGVSVFIVISGYCLMLPVMRGNGALRGGVGRFFLRRARRILPPYYVTLGLSVLLIGLLIGRKTGTHWDVCLPLDTASIPVHLLLLNDAIPTRAPNHVLWSIAVEWHIYFLFPLLVLGWRRLGPLKTMLLTVTLAYVVYFAVRHTQFVRMNLHYVALFAFGMLAATLSQAATERHRRWRDQFPWIGGMLLLLCPVALLCARWDFISVSRRFWFLDFFVGLAAFCLLMAASRPGLNRAHALLAWKPLVFVGVFSYSIYLLHAPLLQVFWQYILQPLGLDAASTFALLALAGTPCIVGLAYLFHLAFERPFMSSRPRCSR